MSSKFSESQDIAVVGIALRFPQGIDNLEKYWNLLSNGLCAISEIPSSRWPTDLFQDSNKGIPGRSVTFKAGIIDHIKNFDASFFGISPKEAEWLDPQQRLLLEVVQECFEDAGIKSVDLKGSNCGVYTGISSLDYGLQAPKDLASVSPYTMTGNTLSLASNRISYVFDLHGPSVSMDTACSSSLVALHHACQAIRNSEVPCAIVAGAHLLQDPYSFVGFSKASMLSPTGTCHPFSEDANGYVRSEGVAVLLLKPLKKALQEHNKIHAIIKASGVNIDGSRKNGLTIPSKIAQQELMEDVLKRSGLSLSDIDYVEAHGTGTPVGDPIESASISAVYAINRSDHKDLPISSAKGNVGHMEPVSGLASFIKAVLSLKHGYIPPIPFDFTPNPNIDFETLKLKCTPKGLKLTDKSVHTAGVNSFGFGGSNAHVIVQTFDHDYLEQLFLNEETTITFQKDNSQLSNTLVNKNNITSVACMDREVDEVINNENFKYTLFLSAKTKSSLKNLCLKHIEAISNLEEKKNFEIIDQLGDQINGQLLNDQYEDLLDAYTYKAFVSRDRFSCRVAFWGSNKDNLIQEIKNFTEGRISAGYCYKETNNNNCRKVAFVFNGNGTQYIGMGSELYKQSLVFKSSIDELSEKIEKYIKFSIKEFLANTSLTYEDAYAIVQNTKLVQPIIFAIQISLVKVLKNLGIVPKAVIGHSMGEIAAATVAGKLTLDEGVKVICIRSMLQDFTRGLGRMAAVSISKEEFLKYCSDNDIQDVCVAAENSFNNITISGNEQTLEELYSYYKDSKIFFKLLDVDYPFHSSYMDSIKDRMLKNLEDIASTDLSHSLPSQKKDILYYSTITGEKCSNAFPLDASYWWHNIRDQVEFLKGVKSLLNDGFDYLIEIGPNAILQRYLKDIAKDNNSSALISSTLKKNYSNLSRMISSAMECHLSCIDLDKKCFFARSYKLSTLNLIELPHYAWDEKFYEYQKSNEMLSDHYRVSPLLGWKCSLEENIWENILEPSKSSLLCDHVVDGQYVVAAADYIEIVLEALNHFDGKDCPWYNIEHLDILSPIAMDNIYSYKSVRVKLFANTLNFEILSRDYLSQDEWVLNVKGRLLPSSLEYLKLDKPISFEQIAHKDGNIPSYSLDAKDIYSLTEKLGLSYGDNFRYLSKVDVNDVTKTFTIFLDTSKYNCQITDFIVYPGIIDAAFQGVLAAVVGKNLENFATYLPVKFGNICICKESEPTFIKGKILKIGTRSILAEFKFFNSKDECVGVLENCRFNVLPKAIIQNKYPVNVWHYDEIPVHHDLLPVYTSEELDLNALKDHLLILENNSVNKDERNNWYQNISPLIENAILYYAYEAFISLKNFEYKKIFSDTTNPLVRYLWELIKKHELVDDENRIRVISENEYTSADEIIKYSYTLCPEALSEILAIYRFGNYLPKLLPELISGSKSMVALNEDKSLISSNFNITSNINSKSSLGIYSAFENLISILCSFKQKDHSIRILEFGGNLTETIINKKFEGNHPNIEIVSLDDSMFLSENFEIKEVTLNKIIRSKECLNHNKFDLIVVNECLRFVKNYQVVLSNLNDLLASQGLLIVIERNSDWSTNVLNGIKDSWWNSDNTSILRDSSYWEYFLKTGYYKTTVYKEPEAQGMQTGFYMILAKKDENNLEAVKFYERQENLEKSSELDSKNIIFVIPDISDKKQNLSIIKKLLDSNTIFNNEETVLREKIKNQKIIAVTYDDILDQENTLWSDQTALNFVFVTVDDNKEVTFVLNALSTLATNLNNKTNCSLAVISITTASEESILDDSVNDLSNAVRGLVRVISNELSNIDTKFINAVFPPCYEESKLNVSSIWRELLLPDGLDEVTVTLDSNIRKTTVIKEGFKESQQVSNYSIKDNSSVETDFYLDFSAPGRLKNLCWFKKPKLNSTQLQPHEVLVDVRVTGLNFRDIMMTMGLVPDDALENGFSGPHLGLEFSGIIKSIGSDVSDFEIGDKVLGFGSSCFTNSLVVNDFSIAKIPNSWSFESAATVPIVFFTAWYAISSLANMEKGESILIHGAAGGVGIAAIQIAHYLGLEIYATVGSPAKRDFLKMLGVQHIYNSRDLDFRSELLKDTKDQGVDAVLNCLSGEAMRESLSVLKPFGRFMELGKRDFVENTSLGIRYFKENISYFAIDVDQLFKFYPTKAKKIFDQVIALFESSNFTPLPYTVFSNLDVVNAFKYMQQGNQIGKVVITFDENKIPSAINNSVAIRNSFENSLPNLSHTNIEKVTSQNIFTQDDVWLITGGTKGFGFATAKYLLSQNIKQVILVSRSGVKDLNVQKEIEDLTRDNKSRILVKCCDVSDYKSVSSLWHDLEQSGISITGIINAAAVFADCLLQDITKEHYEKVWNSKYLGAKNFHVVSKSSANLKYFVVYSSISVAIGNIGQANYVSANSALESLVHSRQKVGLPACAIEWGPISDTGYLEGNEQVKKSLELALGAKSLKSREALSMLPVAISRGDVQIIADINWINITESLGNVPSRMGKLVSSSKEQYQSINSPDFISLIKNKTPKEAIDLISNLISSEIADTMGFTKEQINVDQNLQDLGLDSLMAMDLIVSIEKNTGVKLSVMDFQDNPSVIKLSSKIYQKIIGSDEASISDNSSQKDIVNQVLKTHIQKEDLSDFGVNAGDSSYD